MLHFRNQKNIITTYWLVIIICLGVVLPNQLIINTVQPVIQFALNAKAGWFNGGVKKTDNQYLNMQGSYSKNEQQRVQSITISVIKKTGHLGLFFILGLLVGRELKQRKKNPYYLFFTGVIALVLFAFFSEGLQYFSTSRTPRLHDFFWDIVGGGGGYLVAWACFRVR